MKVLLVAPIKDSYSGYAQFPPLGLGYLATALRENGHQVQLLDCVKERMGFDDFRNYIQESRPQAVGFNVFSLGIKEIKKSLEIVKEVDPAIITLVGGPHPSSLALQVFDHFSKADFAFRGEGEIGLPMFLKFWESNQKERFSQVPGLIWKKDGNVICNPPVFHGNLDDFGFPAWDLMIPQDYVKTGTLILKDTACLITSRGCPFLCTFCAAHIIAGKKIRRRSLENVMQEIDMLDKEYGIRNFVIFDENFTMDNTYVEKFCQTILSRKKDFSFVLPNGVRIDTLNEKLLLLMREAGFSKRIAVGIESGSERILKIIKKSLNKDKIREKISLLNKAGYKPIGYFILGFPTETKEEMMETVRFSLDLKLYRAAFTPLLLLPGTEIYQSLLEHNEIESNIDFSQLATDKVTYSPAGMSKEELNALRRWALLKFHLRPRVLWDFCSDYSSFKFALTKFIHIFLRRQKESIDSH